MILRLGEFIVALTSCGYCQLMRTMSADCVAYMGVQLEIFFFVVTFCLQRKLNGS